ncbi:MAG TPA: hypothetical protein VJ276_09495 [Thermoanaerobaculia bacterium]|nr:hypothetical protein [Thermoanaerobaculia bacterium]
MANVKEEAARMVAGLPDNASWDDLIYQIYVRQSIEEGIADSEADEVVDVAEVRRRFGLD